MKTTNERERLFEACNRLSEALSVDNPQKTAEALALMHVRMSEFIESGYVSYEAIDSELIKLQEE